MAGLSFFPSQNPSPADQASTNALTPGQSAISTISLNLPRILGAQPLTNAGMLGGGATGATHGNIDPQQVVMQALMASAMSTGAPGSAGMDDELRKRLDSLFGASVRPQGIASADGSPEAPMSVPPAAPIFNPGNKTPPTAAPIFTPGSGTHQSNPLGGEAAHPVSGFAVPTPRWRE